MRLCLIFIVGLVLCVSTNVMSQHKVNMHLGETTYKTVFTELRKQTGYVVMYNNAMLDKDDTLKADFDNIDIKTFLDKILKGKGLTYEINAEFIIIVRDPKFIDSETELAKRLVKGIVVDKDGVPLPGVSVFVKGTKVGISTDIDGKFEFKIADKTDLALVFSFVGMQTQEIVYTFQEKIKVVMKDDSEQLEEVVVTGYQTISRERATGSFSLIGSDDLEERVTNNITESLDGMVSGLYVDGDDKITIRGVGTLYGDTDPLIVVDGFPVESDLSTINPDDIKSVTVLKDAAATSIWGVKAANGVIVVTTKMGAYKGKTDINISYYLSIEEHPSFSDVDICTTAEAVDYELGVLADGRWKASDVQYYPQYALNPLQKAVYDKYSGAIDQQAFDARIAELKTVDAYKQLEEAFLQNAVSHQLNLSMSGGSENSRYYASIVYNGNESTSVGNKNSRLNVNLKNEYFLSEKFTLSTAGNFTYSRGENNGFDIVLLGRMPHYQALVDENGEVVQYYMVEDEKGKELESKGYLPYTTSMLDELKYRDNTSKGFDGRIQVGLNYKVLPGLVIDTKFQYERGYYKADDLKSIRHPDTRKMINTYTKEDGDGGLEYGIPKGDWLKATKNDHEAWTWRNQLSYNASFDDNKHQISAIGGTEIRKYVTYGFEDEKFGYDPQSLKYVPVDEAAWLSTMQNNGAWYGRTGMAYGEFSTFSEEDNRDVSVFLNGSYTYNGKYTVNASGRVDQSNLFGSNKKFRYKPLWSAGLSWKMSAEDFMSDIQWLDKLIVRSTFGVGGSTNKKFYPEMMGAVDISFFTGDRYMKLTNPANENLKWESAYMFNFGIDWSVLSNRIWGSIEVYNKDSKDIVGRQVLDGTYGWSAANVNFASINNRGIELALNAIPYKTKDFIWETNLNIANNKNEVVEVGVSGATLYNYLYTLSSFEYVDQYAQIGFLGYLGLPIKGKPLSRVYAYKYGGLDNKGEPMIYNDNDELVAWNEYTGNTNALKYMGTSTPPVFGNLRNSFSYKGLKLAINITYKLGHVFRAPRSTRSQVFEGLYMKDIAERWQKPGDEATTNVPKYDRWNAYYMNGYYSYADINVLKGDIIRLKDLSLDYNLAKSIIEKTPFKSLNLRFQAKNLWLWTANDEDIDPDKVSYGPTFPTPKSFVVGVKATF